MKNENGRNSKNEDFLHIEEKTSNKPGLIFSNHSKSKYKV